MATQRPIVAPKASVDRRARTAEKKKMNPLGIVLALAAAVIVAIGWFISNPGS